MGFLARLAVERGCVRFDSTAETDNPEALAFYDRLGAGRVAEGSLLRGLARTSRPPPWEYRPR
jgi:hypothetical protein